MSKKVAILLATILVVVGILVAYRIKNNQAKADIQAAGAKRAESKVYGVVVEGKPFSDFLSLTGSIEPNEIVTLRSEISGIVEDLSFEEGTIVADGHILLRISDAELLAQLAQAKTRNELAGENERRAKLLLEKQAISQEEYDIASADYRTSQSQITLIEAQLKKTRVRAPFSGKIGLRNISKGSYITPATDIAQLVNMNKVKLQFSIPEKYASRIRNGVGVKFTVQEQPQEFVANIYAAEPAIDVNTRTLRVRAIADNHDYTLIPGTFANVIFPLDLIDDGLLVPAESLVPVQNGKKLFVMKNGVAREVLVETGGRTAADVLITKGIAIGDTILTSGVMALRDGSEVKVTLR